MNTPTVLVVQEAMASGKKTYDSKSKTVRPKTNYPQFVSENYHAAKQQGLNHPQALKSVAYAYHTR